MRGDTPDFGTNLIVGHAFNVVKNLFKLVYETRSLFAAYELGELACRYKLFRSGGLSVFIELFTRDVLICLVDARERRSARKRIRSAYLYGSVGNACGYHGVYVHLLGAPVDVVCFDFDARTFVKYRDVDAGERYAAETLIGNKPFKI